MPDTLYKANKNPKKSVKNTGFKNKEKALETIRIVKDLEKQQNVYCRPLEYKKIPLQVFLQHDGDRMWPLRS